MKAKRHLVFLIGLAFVSLFITSCINEKSDVEKVTQLENLPVESTYDSEIYYSENAELKVKAFAPVIHRYMGEIPYSEMPKGVEVTFYDSIDHESSKLTANYAIDKQTEFLMEAKYDVVIVNSEGQRLNTEHLIWDRKNQRIYSNVFTTITTDDEVIMGDGFESNERFTKYKILKPKGTISQEDEEYD